MLVHFLIAIHVLFPSAIAAAPPLVAEWPGYKRGIALSVATSESIAYIACWGVCLQVADISDPSDPRVIRSIDIKATELKIENDLLIVAAHDEVALFDISVPSMPLRRGTFVLHPDYVRWPYPRGLAIGNSKLFFSGGGETLRVLDISNPDSPVLVRVGGWGGSCNILSGTVLIGVSEGGLQLSDVSDPAQHVFLKWAPFTQSVGQNPNAVIRGNILAVSGVSGLLLFDISDPLAPQQIGAYNGHLGLNAPLMRGSIIYFSARTPESNIHNVLIAIDISDPRNPRNVGAYPFPYCASLALDSETLVAAGDHDGVRTARLTPAGITPLVLQTPDSGQTRDLSVSGEQILLADFAGGFRSFSFDPARGIEKLGSFPAKFAIAVAGVGDVAAADTGEATHILSLEDASSPTRLALINHTDSGYQFVKRVFFQDGRYCRVADRIQVWNISGPTPIWTHTIGSTSRPFDALPINNNFALVNQFGLFLRNLQNGLLFATGSRDFSTLAAEGDTLFTWERSRINPVLVFDVTDPSNIVQTQLNLFGHPLAVDGSLFIISTDTRDVVLRDGHLRFFNIRNRQNPRFLGELDTGGRIRRVMVKNAHLFVADEERGLLVYDVTAYIEPTISIVAPAQQFLTEGSRIEFQATVTGPAPITYVWYKNGQPINGISGTTLTIPNATAADSGEYWLVASNAAGTVESPHFRVTVFAHVPVTVTTIAGSGEQGHLDSQSPLTAKLSSPDGGGVTSDGIIYFGDSGNHVIRYLLPNGEVGTLAGTPSVSGYREDFGLNSLFNVPLGLHVTANGDLLVGDYANHRVRKISGRGYARSTLLAGGGNDPGLQPIPGPNVRLNGPNDVVQTPTGEIYFTEFLNHTIRKIDLEGKVTLIAGSPNQPGYINATGQNARFNGPAGIAFHNDTLYITDWNNHRIRKVTLNGEVTTHAGSGAPGLQSGYGTAAQFSAPNGIAADPAGNLYITEYSNHTIRRIAPDGWVSTLAGNGTPAHADGDRDTARFNAPGGICLHPDGSLIITDTGNHRLRRLVLNNTTTPITPTETLVTAELNPTLKIHGAPGERYRIESTDTLTPNNWQPLETITLTTSPQTWTDPRPPLQSRLYRSIREQ